MDTTKQYIKMCEKAGEIQKEWKPKEGDYYLPYNPIPNIHLIGSRHTDALKSVIKDLECIFLPNQSQLQEMVKWSWNNTGIILYRLVGFWKHNESQFTSMEQLWLVFVMQEKYGKIWDEKNWVAERRPR